MSATDREADRVALAEARLAREYAQRTRALTKLAAGHYHLSAEDAAEVVNDTLMAWYRKLSSTGALGSDRLFCERVLRYAAIDRIRRRRPAPVELSAIADEVGADPELDTLIAEREEARELCRLAGRVLSEQELRIVWLLAEGYERREVSRRVGASERQVKRSLERARRKLSGARQADRSLAA
jgi:RNA polymerase sigma-70 factor (ECF subfamily)